MVRNIKLSTGFFDVELINKTYNGGHRDYLWKVKAQSLFLFLHVLMR